MRKLTLRTQPPVPLELDGVIPENLLGLSDHEVALRPVLLGNRTVELGEFFDVKTTNNGGDDVLSIDGDCSTIKRIGAGMTTGCITALHVGIHAGAGMTGGTLGIIGNAGDWLGAEMTGGCIRVIGNAGNQVGAAYRGSRRGMRGGKILIDGDAGAEAGLLMRRGFITILGDCGEFAGASMIAGTLFVFGKLGARAGAGMKRGTIAAFGECAPLPPGFRETCEYEPTFLRPYLNELRTARANVPPHLFDPTTRYHCSRGDVMTGGHGEVLRLLG